MKKFFQTCESFENFVAFWFHNFIPQRLKYYRKRFFGSGNILTNAKSLKSFWNDLFAWVDKMSCVENRDKGNQRFYINENSIFFQWQFVGECMTSIYGTWKSIRTLKDSKGTQKKRLFEYKKQMIVILKPISLNYIPYITTYVMSKSDR